MTSSVATAPGRGVVRTAGSRGVVSGALLALLGLWSVLVSLVGPYFGYALSPAGAWTAPWALLWLQIVPGAALLLAGIGLMLTGFRVVGLVAGALAAATGLWLAVGPALWSWPSTVALAGTPGAGVSAAEEIGMATGLGAVVTLLAGLALGRFSVRGTRDVTAAHQRGREDGREAPRPAPGSHDARPAEPGGGPGADRTAVPEARRPEEHRADRPTDA
jgi:hypothetical protein